MKGTVFLLLAFSGVVGANPLCLTDTLANYQANYTNLATACQVGDKLFYAFNYSVTTSPVSQVGPTNSQVTVTGDPSDPNEPGLIFSSTGWTVSGISNSSFNISIDSNIRFTVSTIGLNPIIHDGSLTFAGTESVTGLGQAQIAETITPQGQASVGIGVDSNAGPFTSVGNFLPVATVAVSKDLVVRIPRVTGPFVASSATITSFREGFSEGVPEPTTFLLIGSGLAGALFFRRRR
jgi:hypothetical protein